LKTKGSEGGILAVQSRGLPGREGAEGVFLHGEMEKYGLNRLLD